MSICVHCNGSGEGMYDGTTCHYCKGRGEEPLEQLLDEDDLYDMKRQEKLDREMEECSCCKNCCK